MDELNRDRRVTFPSLRARSLAVDFQPFVASDISFPFSFTCHVLFFPASFFCHSKPRLAHHILTARGARIRGTPWLPRTKLKTCSSRAERVSSPPMWRSCSRRNIPTTRCVCAACVCVFFVQGCELLRARSNTFGSCSTSARACLFFLFFSNARGTSSRSHDAIGRASWPPTVEPWTDAIVDDSFFPSLRWWWWTSWITAPTSTTSSQWPAS